MSYVSYAVESAKNDFLWMWEPTKDGGWYFVAAALVTPVVQALGLVMQTLGFVVEVVGPILYLFGWAAWFGYCLGWWRAKTEAGREGE